MECKPYIRPVLWRKMKMNSKILLGSPVLLLLFEIPGNTNVSAETKFEYLANAV